MQKTLQHFQNAAEMPYAYMPQVISKFNDLSEKLKSFLKGKKSNKEFTFKKGETIYVPDLHGDFVHLILTLHKHGAIDKDLNLKKDFEYVFLGDFYDRAPDSDAIDHWLNLQIKKEFKIYRLIGNHEFAFLERDPNGYPVILPSQDSIKDLSNSLIITENLLKNIASGNILAVYVNPNTKPMPTIYAHSYIVCDDFTELSLSKNEDIMLFAIALNQRLKEHGEKALEIFHKGRKENRIDWKLMVKSFHEDPLFNLYKKRVDVNTSFLWRRTGLPRLNIFPAEFETPIPDNVYQIIGHTPIFSFALPQSQPINKPFVIKALDGTGMVQFSDVGIGYYYKKDEVERPEVIISHKCTIQAKLT